MVVPTTKHNMDVSRGEGLGLQGRHDRREGNQLQVQVVSCFLLINAFSTGGCGGIKKVGFL